MLIDYDEAVWAVAVQLAFEADMECSGEHEPTEYTDVARAWLKGVPTIEPKRGRWIMQKVGEPDEYCVCSECGSRAESDEAWNFCPNCGVRMEEEK